MPSRLSPLAVVATVRANNNNNNNDDAAVHVVALIVASAKGAAAVDALAMISVLPRVSKSDPP